MSFDEKSSAKELNDELVARFDFGLANLENSLSYVQTTYNLIGFRKRVQELELACRRFEALKRRLLKQVDDFLEISGRWKRIMTRHNTEREWRRDDKYNFIKEEFHLNELFQKIDQEIKDLNRRIHIINSVRLPTAEKRKRIQPYTLIMLVWLQALSLGCTKPAERYRVAYKLLAWFIENRNDLFTGSISKLKDLDAASIRHDYERYIQMPNDSQKVYQEWAQQIYIDTFCESA